MCFPSLFTFLLVVIILRRPLVYGFATVYNDFNKTVIRSFDYGLNTTERIPFLTVYMHRFNTLESTINTSNTHFGTINDITPAIRVEELTNENEYSNETILNKRRWDSFPNFGWEDILIRENILRDTDPTTDTTADTTDTTDTTTKSTKRTRSKKKILKRRTRTKDPRPRYLTGCYDVIKPCLTVCEGVYRTFCNEFTCSETLKNENRYECYRLCHIGFRNADTYKTKRPTPSKFKQLKLKNRRFGGNDVNEYDIFDTTEPYLTKSPTTLGPDAMYDYLDPNALFYRRRNANGEDELIERTGDEDYEAYDEYYVDLTPDERLAIDVPGHKWTQIGVKKTSPMTTKVVMNFDNRYDEDDMFNFNFEKIENND